MAHLISNTLSVRSLELYERPKILTSEERLTSGIAFPSRHAKTTLAVSKTISLVVNNPLWISSDISWLRATIRQTYLAVSWWELGWRSRNSNLFKITRKKKEKRFFFHKTANCLIDLWKTTNYDSLLLLKNMRKICILFLRSSWSKYWKQEEEILKFLKYIFEQYYIYLYIHV